jgi:hypothetical protein
MQMIFSSFVLPRELRRAWKRAAKAERVSASEFLRRSLRERMNRAATPKQEQDGDKR